MTPAIERADTAEQARLQAEVDALALEIAILESQLAECSHLLAEFEQRYRVTVAPLLAKVEELEAELAALRAAWAARVAEGSAEGGGGEEKPESTLRDQYRRLAKRFHPDHATDEADGERRALLMVELNRAYAAGDAAAMAKLELEAGVLQGESAISDVGQRIVDLLRYRAALSERVNALRAELASLEASALETMRKRAERAGQVGEDYLEALAGDLRERIETLVDQVMKEAD